MDVPSAASAAPRQRPGADTAFPRRLRVGTRGSPLALAQTRAFIARITESAAAQGLAIACEECVIRTSGDASQASDRRLSELGGKGLWAHEIHQALCDERVDVAVHSLKDLETELPDSIVLAATLPRADGRDALILGPGCGVPDPADPWAALPRGAVVGTASVRRQAQLLHARPDLQVVPLRGNVQTRLDKLAAGTCAATLLAQAGLERLGLGERASLVLEPAVLLPACCQGIIGVTARADDGDLLALLAALSDPESHVAAEAERALLAALDGSCRTPIGGWARLEGGTLHLEGLVARADGSFLLRRGLAGPVEEAAHLGASLGLGLRAASPAELFA